MQTFTTIVAIVAVIGVIWGLIKRYETRLVLITGGLVMAFPSFKPMFKKRPRNDIPLFKADDRVPSVR